MRKTIPLVPTSGGGMLVSTCLWALLLAGMLVAVCVSVGVWSEPAKATYPGKNGKIAFYAYPAFNTDTEIYVTNPDGSGRRQVTNNIANDYDPVWSPDGSKIAFWKHARYGQSEIWVKNIKTGQVVRLSDPHDSMEEAHPSWSPDGTRMVFTGYNHVDGSGEIWVMNSDGSERKQLTTNSMRAIGEVEWSPDGSKIAFSTHNYENDIFVMNSDGTNLQNLTNTGENDNPLILERDLTWSPDGSKIAFFRSPWPNGVSDIWVMNADGSGKWNLTKTPETSEGDPTWSPNGRKIAFLGPDLSGFGGDLWKMNADGTNPQNITNSSGSSYSSPDWQPIPMATP